MIEIILDTDIGCDCDDAGALAVLHALTVKYSYHIKAITGSAPLKQCAALIDVINRYYGVKIPVGKLTKNRLFCEYKDIYCEKTIAKFSKTSIKNKYYPHAVNILRKALSECRDKSVLFIEIGPQTNMAELLFSKPDKNSDMTGLELLERKLSKTFIMAGRFVDETPEFNVLSDISAAQMVASYWPGEIVYSPHELGAGIITGNCFTETQCKENPVSFAYQIHSGNEGRYSWDPITVLYALESGTGLFVESTKGEVSITDDGITHFSESEEKRHSILNAFAATTEIENYINELIV